MNAAKYVVKAALRLLPRRLRTVSNFILRAGYVPNLDQPRTFNEKLQYRKMHWNNPLFIRLADKAAAKDYVASVLGDEYVIPSVFTGTDLTLGELRSCIDKYDAVVVKSTHGSGSVYFLDKTSGSTDMQMVLAKVRSDLKVDHGVRSDEPWYSAITPQIIIEPNIGGFERVLPDYKFHVFSRFEQASPEIVIQVDYDRHTQHRRSFFDADGQVLDFGIQLPRSSRERVVDPTLIARLQPLAIALAKPFTYVRVDLYDTTDGPKFGEFTFAHGSGYERFSPRIWDLKLGQLWHGDPAE